MGHLVAHRAQDLLADELCDDHLDRLVQAGTLRKPARAVRQEPGDFLDEGVHVFARDSRQAHDGVPLGEVFRGQHLRFGPLARDGVGLRDDENLARACGRHQFRHPPIAAAHGLGCVYKHGDDVHALDGLQGRIVECGAERVFGLVQARRVHNDHLHVVGVVNGTEAVARRLRRVGGDGELLAHDGVEQRGLARIGAAHERDEAAAESGGVDVVGRGVIGNARRLQHLVQISRLAAHALLPCRLPAFSRAVCNAGGAFVAHAPSG